MVHAEALTLTEVVLHLRAELLDRLGQSPSDANRAALTNLWRTCLTIHDVAEQRGDAAYVEIMEQMIDAVADYDTLDEPHTMDWITQLPTTAAIEEAGRA